MPGYVSNTYVRLLFEYFEAAGHDTSGLGTAPDADPLGRTPLEAWVAMLDRAAQLIDDPLLGLRLGQRITPRHFGVVGYVTLHCPDLGEALQRMQHFMPLVYDAQPMRVDTTHSRVEVSWDRSSYMTGPQAEAAGVAVLVAYARNITGRSLQLSYVDFHYPAQSPEVADAFEDYFGCPVHFGQVDTSLAFPLRQMSLPLREADPGLASVLEQQAEHLLKQLPVSDPFEAEVRRILAGLVHEGRATTQVLADTLHLSRRTLMRRLAERGLRFQALLDETRQMLAQQYLRDPSLTLTEVGQLLGYSEQAAFNHAFRRWTGQKPSAYRDSLQ